jgi:hypothetical protein
MKLLCLVTQPVQRDHLKRPLSLVWEHIMTRGGAEFTAAAPQ